MSLALRSDSDDEQRGLVGLATDVALKPVRPFVSKPARQAYLTTFLLASTGVILFGFAVTAYTLFYWSYIPRIGFERVIHLQYDNVYSVHKDAAQNAHPYPYGIAALASDLVSAQNYDVVVELTLPRTPENQDAGNFMVEVTMYAPANQGSGAPAAGNVMDTLRLDTASTGASPDTSKLLARSRRSASVPYRSPVVDLLYKITEVPFYLLNLRDDTISLRVPLFEGLSFARGWRNMPSTFKVEIQSSHRLQIYNVRAKFRARFQGLRWLMYNHRVISAILFVGGFWTTEIIFAGLAWGVVTLYLAKATELEIKAEEIHEVAEKVKQEDDDDVKPNLSDTERTFPTLGGQQPLRYVSPTPNIKQEELDAPVMVPESVTRAVEADDEDDDVDFFDSGLGTSMESSDARKNESIRRRRGRLTGREDNERPF